MTCGGVVWCLEDEVEDTEHGHTAIETNTNHSQAPLALRRWW